MVFNNFGAPTKVFINQDMEFCREFQKLCEKTLIDHRTTSQDHHKVDGLIEWMVSMVKRGLQNMDSKRAIFKIRTCNDHG
jgi:hypothetical protein